MVWVLAVGKHCAGMCSKCLAEDRGNEWACILAAYDDGSLRPVPLKFDETMGEWACRAVQWGASRGALINMQEVQENVIDFMTCKALVASGAWDQERIKIMKQMKEEANPVEVKRGISEKK